MTIIYIKVRTYNRFYYHFRLVQRPQTSPKLFIRVTSPDATVKDVFGFQVHRYKQVDNTHHGCT